MSPLISIITPSLNQGAYLERTLDSVAEQRGVAVEHIAFDPGSIDGSRGRLRDWRDGPNRRLFLEPDAGPAEAINKGIARAEGEIVGWLCSDDFYATPNALAAVAEAFAANPKCGIAYGRASFVDEAGLRKRAGPWQREPTNLAQTFRAGAPFLQPAVFVRRFVFDQAGLLDPTFGLAFDVEFWLRAAGAGIEFVALDADIACKRVHAESATQLLPAIHAMDCARAVRAHFERGGDAWVARAIAEDVAEWGDVAALTTATAQRRLNRPEGLCDTLIVLGNGPSLAGFDFDQLRGRDAIGMNAAYRHWRRIGWFPRYYACLDSIVGASHGVEIEAMVCDAEALGIDAFLLRDNLIDEFGPAARSSPRVLSFDTLFKPGGFLDVLPITTGSHAALFGALLGYRTLILLGVDGNYVERIDGAEAREGIELELVRTPRENPNYYFEDYQRAGDHYSVPNPMPGLHLECWRMVGDRLRGRGVQVWNASPSSRVDAFAFRPLSQLRANAA